MRHPLLNFPTQIRLEQGSDAIEVTAQFLFCAHSREYIALIKDRLVRIEPAAEKKILAKLNGVPFRWRKVGNVEYDLLEQYTKVPEGGCLCACCHALIKRGIEP